jgi:crotonobetainyl-CoA:carnitine CoA-transferase CaiB-like acyl-CoA transferase
VLVLELSDTEAAAAWSGRVFGWAGDEVVKVSSPRRPAPEPALDLYLNEGKQRTTLDYREEAGRRSIDALAAGADIVVTDAPAADVEQYRLLDIGRPGGVTVSITPYGLDGPWRDWKATAPTLLAHGGYTDLMGDAGRAPLTLPGSYPYYQAGTVATLAAIASLRTAENRDRPTPVQLSILETLAGVHQFTDVMWTAWSRVRSRHGNRFEGVYPIGLWPCQDGWFSLCVLEQMWFRFCYMLDRPDLAEGHSLSVNAGRIADLDAVDEAVLTALGDWPKERIFKESQETWRVASGHLLSLDEVLEDRHLGERGFWRPSGLDVPGGAPASIRMPGAPFRYHPGGGQGGQGGQGGEGGRPRVPAEPTVAPAPAGPAEPAGAAAPAAPAAPAARAEPAIATAPISRVDRPLAGLRVLELSDYWAGPLCGRTFGDLGADVILVEKTAGAPLRTALFDKLNRNKRSIALDLKTPEGRDVFLQLVRQADVVVENLSARSMPGLGLGYPVLQATNPHIVYASISGFGTSGPYADYLATGPSAEPMTGLNALMGYSEFEPRVTSKGILDPISGNLGAAAILAALRRRDVSGEGCFVELTLQECGIAFIGDRFVDWQTTGRPPVYGNADTARAPWGVYRCRGADDWIVITITDDEEWAALCAFAGEGWESVDGWDSMPSRQADRYRLDAAVEAWTASHDKIDLARALQRHGVPAAPVLRAPEWIEDAQLAYDRYFASLPGPEASVLRCDGLAPRTDGGRDYSDWVPAPLPGQHTGEVLTEVLGLDTAEVALLLAAQVAAVSD